VEHSHKVILHLQQAACEDQVWADHAQVADWPGLSGRLKLNTCTTSRLCKGDFSIAGPLTGQV
jgi:hypothetical protein